MNTIRCFLALVMMGMLASCNTLGSKVIRGERINYNQSIAHSSDEQLLLNLVRLKYRDTPFFLEVSNVSTHYNVSFSANASPSFGLGNSERTSISAKPFGTLTGKPNRGVDLSSDETNSRNQNVGTGAGVAYSENPTVVYTPLQGQRFVEQMLSPIQLPAVALLSGSGWSLELVMRLCFEEMNGLSNCSTASGPTPSQTPEYKEFVQVTKLLKQLQEMGVARLTMQDKGQGVVQMILSFAPNDASAQAVIQCKNLLKLAPDKNEFPVICGSHTNQTDRIMVRTRSLLGVMYFLSQSVKVPEQDIENGLVTVTCGTDGVHFNWEEPLGDILQIQCNPPALAPAFVKINYRDANFYIADSDLNSKTTFGLLLYLFYLEAGDVKSIIPTLILR